MPGQARQDRLPSGSQNRTLGERKQGHRLDIGTLTCENVVELRGFEPLTPSMRTSRMRVYEGHSRRSAVRGWSNQACLGRCGCCTLLLHMPVSRPEGRRLVARLLTLQCQEYARGSMSFIGAGQSLDWGLYWVGLARLGCCTLLLH